MVDGLAQVSPNIPWNMSTVEHHRAFAEESILKTEYSNRQQLDITFFLLARAAARWEKNDSKWVRSSSF